MYLHQVRSGQVIHNTRKDDYARVVGLRTVGDKIVIEVHHVGAVDTETEFRFRLNPDYVFWDLVDCEPLTNRELGDGNELQTQLELGATEHLDREV